MDGVGWMLDPAISGGGCLRNVGIHTVDGFLRYTQGEADRSAWRRRSAIARMARRLKSSAPRCLRSESGVIGTVEAGYSYASMKPGGDFRGSAIGRELLYHRPR